MSFYEKEKMNIGKKYYKVGIINVNRRDTMVGIFQLQNSNNAAFEND